MVDIDDDQAWDRQFVEVEILAEPGLEKPPGRGTVDDARAGHARKACRDRHLPA